MKKPGLRLKKTVHTRKIRFLNQNSSMEDNKCIHCGGKPVKLVRCSWISKMGYDKFHGCSYTLEGFDFGKRQSLGRCIYTQTLFLCRYSFFVQGRRPFCKRSYQTIAGLQKPRKASCLSPHGMSIGVESRRRKLGLSLSRFQI